MKIIGIVGWKNNGKTVLIERLVAHFTALGLRISTVKHAHHEFDIDRPGKDSHRHRAAGAGEVIVASSKRWALMHEVGGGIEPSLDELIAHLAPADLVIFEGFKNHAHPKIEVVLDRAPPELVSATMSDILAVATNIERIQTSLPVLPLDRPGEIANFIAGYLDLPSRT